MAVGRQRIQGAAELERTLRNLGVQMAQTIGLDANEEAAEELKDELIVHAPYLDRPSTKKTRRRSGGTISTYDYGHLRDNINVQLVPARKGGRFVHIVGIGDAFWGRFLEFGTANMRARPWMRPVFDRLVQRLIKTQVRMIQQGIERAASRRKSKVVGRRDHNSVY